MFEVLWNRVMGVHLRAAVEGWQLRGRRKTTRAAWAGVLQRLTHHHQQILGPQWEVIRLQCKDQTGLVRRELQSRKRKGTCIRPLCICYLGEKRNCWENSTAPSPEVNLGLFCS